MKPGTHNFECYQGATFSQRFYLAPSSDGEPRDLTGYSVRMQVRKSSSADPVVEFTEANGRATIGTDNKVTLTLSATDTANLAASLYHYDVELVSGSTVLKPLRGTFKVVGEVTR